MALSPELEQYYKEMEAKPWSPWIEIEEYRCVRFLRNKEGAVVDAQIAEKSDIEMAGMKWKTRDQLG